MLLLSNEHVEQALAVPACVDTLREFFAEDARGQAVSRPRTEVWVPRESPSIFYQCKTMEGAVAYRHRHVLRIDSNLSVERHQGHLSRVEHLPLVAAGWMGMLLVFDIASGELLGVMPDGYLQRTRVGSLYALAAERLARNDATRVGLIGSGWQAGGQLLALACVRPIDRVRVYSPDADHCQAFARAMCDALGIVVESVRDARSAMEGADIVVLATNSGQKVLEADWATPGQHINSVRFRELAPDLYERSDRVVVNREEGWIQNYVLGEQAPRDVTESTLPPAPPARSIEARLFFAGTGGRQGANELTLFPNEASNFHLGGQFAAVASYVYDRACTLGLGRELPVEWFSQKLHP